VIYKLSKVTLKKLENSYNKKNHFLKSGFNPSSQEFYYRHPDLTPDDAYLRNGRIATTADARENIKKCLSFFNKLKNKNNQKLDAQY